MSTDVQTLKAAVDFRQLVTETHEIDRSGKVLCPEHDDHTPSCHIYGDHFHCFPCGAHGDALDWLELVHDLSTAEAIKELERRAGGYIPPAAERPLKASRPAPTSKPVAARALELHQRQAAGLYRVPSAMEGRGFSLTDLQHLGFAAYGDDAVFPITGPDRVVLALKRRYAKPRDGQRYRYATPGHGTPAWCSPGLTDHGQALVIEGELNAMACWLAMPELAVMGIAGTGGSLHVESLKNKVVYLYADPDGPGRTALTKWGEQAKIVGARKVLVLEPWNKDACDVAGDEGRPGLKKRLIERFSEARSFDAMNSFSASNTASKGLRLGRGKLYLMFSCSGFSCKPDLGPKSARAGMPPKVGGKPCL